MTMTTATWTTAMAMDIERISPAATRATHEVATPITRELIAAKAAHARESARQRDIHIFHSGESDTLQRMLNALQPGTYVQPHRHITPPKAESIVLLQGAIGFVPFLDDGSINRDHWLLMDKSCGCIGIDYRAGIWHTFFALAEDTVLFEVKPGPYDAATDKEFAAWAPAEGDAVALAYLAKVEDEFREHHGLGARGWRVD